MACQSKMTHGLCNVLYGTAGIRSVRNFYMQYMNAQTCESIIIHVMKKMGDTFFDREGKRDAKRKERERARERERSISRSRSTSISISISRSRIE